VIVTVFGSGQIKEDDPEYKKAMEVGRRLAQAGFAVCNGGYAGVMEASARGAKEADGETIGILTGSFSHHANRWIDEVRTTKTWRERLFQLIDTGNAYVICDGGTGTMVELFTVWEMTNKNALRKPIILFGSFIRSHVEALRKNPLFLFNDRLKLAATGAEVIQHLESELGSGE